MKQQTKAPFSPSLGISPLTANSLPGALPFAPTGHGSIRRASSERAPDHITAEEGLPAAADYLSQGTSHSNFIEGFL